MNKNQKQILYKNIGILIALLTVCTILSRCGILNRGETLEDLAQKQQSISEAPSEADTSAEPPKKEISFETSASAEPSEKKTSFETSAAQPENEPEQLQEDDFMDDRIIYQEGFYYQSLSDTIKEKITGISYPADDDRAAISYDMLRYVHVLYYDFDNECQSGELICHKAIARDLTEIFYALYEARYPIEKIKLVDEYQGDDDLSMQDNNTSCFNYRALPSGRLSNHAYGLAIDINPLYNPYITYAKDGTVKIAPQGGENYADRDQTFIGKIDKEDLAYQLFLQHGFTWGGNWRSSKDYQHFEKAI